MTGLVVVLAALAVHEAVFTVHHALRCDDQRCRCPLTSRWLAGRTLNGRVVTDAGFRTRASRVLTRTGHASPFQKLPGWQRRAWRTGGTAAATALGLGLILHPAATEQASAAALAALAAAGTWLGLRWWRRLPHHREFMQPLHARIAGPCEVPLSEKPRKWLEVPPDRNTAVIRLPLGLDVTPKLLETVERETVRTLGLPAGTEMTPKLQGASRELRFAVVKPPPPLVLLDPDPGRDALGLRKAIEAAQWHELVMGYGVGANLVKKSLGGAVPHWGMSMPTGDGKSVTAELLAAQMLFHGAFGIILDYKLFSHPWALFKMPNVHYAGTPEQIHLTLLWLEGEMARRRGRALDGIDMTGEFHRPIGPVIFVVAEELNTTITQLKRYWKSIGGTGPSPAVEALHELMFIGRGLRIHMLLIAQKLMVSATGHRDSSVLENCAGLLIGGGASPSTWKNRAEDIIRPPKQTHPGRHYVVTGGTAELCQVGWLNPKGKPGPEARQLALAGDVTPRPDGMPEGIAKPVTDLPGGGGALVTPIWGSAGETGTNSRPALESGRSGNAVTAVDEADIRDTPLSLREAAERGIVRCSHAAIKMDRHRDPDFPQPVAEGARGELLYNAADLFAYDAARRG